MAKLLLLLAIICGGASFAFYTANGAVGDKHCVHCGSVALPKPGCGSHCRGRFGGVLDRSSVSVFRARLARRTKALAVLSEPSNCG
jgi:hypothetical protein